MGLLLFASSCGLISWFTLWASNLLPHLSWCRVGIIGFGSNRTHGNNSGADWGEEGQKETKIIIGGWKKIIFFPVCIGYFYLFPYAPALWLDDDGIQIPSTPLPTAKRPHLGHVQSYGCSQGLCTWFSKHFKPSRWDIPTTARGGCCFYT